MTDEMEEGGPANPEEVADYIREMATELALLARRAGLGRVAVALELARMAAREALQENAAEEDAA